METIEQIREEIIALVSGILEVAPDQVNTHESLSRFGVDSIKAALLKANVEEKYEIVIPYELLLTGPSIDTICDHIFQSTSSSASIDTDDEVFTF
jgi:acyl carrier protein